MRHTEIKKGGRRIDRTFFAQIYLSGFLLLPARPVPTSPRLASDKKPAAIVYGVNFTSAFHTHARRSALMDFHLSPLPTHPALIIRGMRTSTWGMPGCAVEFMTSTETDAGIARHARQLAAISKKSAAIRRVWDNFSDHVTIRCSSIVNAIGEANRHPRRHKPRRIGLN